MIIVQLTGGLGNQMFQYAAAKALSIKKNTELLLDVSSFLRTELPDLEVPRDFELIHFKGVSEKVVNINELKNQKKFEFLEEKKLKKLLPKHKRGIYREKFYHFDDQFFNANSSSYLIGIWQSPRYFELFKNIITQNFQIKESSIQNVLKKGLELSKSNSVSIHIRRGDYLRKPIILDWHGIMSKEYYLKAFETLSSKTTIDKVYYFSDEPEWVESELLPYIPGEIISNQIATSQYEDFYLMNQCQNNIIANSSFSWWAAYLNPNPNKIVIAPKKWFNSAPNNTKDLFPPDWITI
jgi:hypothetical protein